ncbi:ATP-binding protein [Bradyrhizobium sp. LM2.3]
MRSVRAPPHQERIRSAPRFRLPAAVVTRLRGRCSARTRPSTRKTPGSRRCWKDRSAAAAKQRALQDGSGAAAPPGYPCLSKELMVSWVENDETAWAVPMMAEPGQLTVYICREWEIDLARRELRLTRELVPLGGRAFEILAELVQAQGHLVTKKDLTERVWRGVFVEESALRVHIAAIRKALGPDRDMLSTAVGRGYRLLGAWQIQHIDTPPQSVATGLPPSINIPNAAFDLIGRTAAIVHLWRLLSAYRIVSLVGPGGIGKTSLALEAARTPPPGFVADRLLVELASLSDPKLVCSVIAGVLGAKLGGEEISPDAIARAIGHRPLLLILDNCEHVIDAVAVAAELIVSRCSGTFIVATSREALRIEGEHVYRVPPLDVPPESRFESAGASAYSAVELFTSRAKALGSSFASDEENISAVATICRRLDGIPLAIEFAAARAAMLSPPKIAALLDDRFKFLTTGRRTALPRQQTLRATLDWSYDLLPDDEAWLLRQLGIFAGEFELDAVIAVAGEGISDVTGQLARLVVKSLVLADIRGDSPHYRLLDTTRAYALEKLHAAGEHPDAACREAKYCCGVFARAEADKRSKAAGGVARHLWPAHRQRPHEPRLGLLVRRRLATWGGLDGGCGPTLGAVVAPHRMPRADRTRPGAPRSDGLERAAASYAAVGRARLVADVRCWKGPGGRSRLG